jgi:hypothetical protein
MLCICIYFKNLEEMIGQFDIVVNLKRLLEIVNVYLLCTAGGVSGGATSVCTEMDTALTDLRGTHTPSSPVSLTLLTQTQAENCQLKRDCEELNRANRLYEEQILLMRDRIRELETTNTHQLHLLQQQQQQQQHRERRGSPIPSPIPSPRTKSRSHSVSSMNKNYVSAAAAASPSRTSFSEAGPGGGGGPVSAMLEMENVKLQDRVMQLEDQLSVSHREKESLVSTLQLLQDELFQSERQSQRSSSSSGM